MNKIKEKLIIIGLATIGLAGLTKVGIDKKFYVYIGTVILFFLFIFAIFSNKKKIKEYASKLSSFLFMYKFNCFFITVGIVFFLLELYVLFIYSITTVFYYKFLTHLFPVWDEKKLLLEHAKIDNTIYDDIEWGSFQLFAVTLILIISVVFNTIFAKFYLAVLLLGAVIRFSGFKMSQHFPLVFRRFKQFKKDLLTLKFHWYKDFRVARDIAYISLISLGISVFLATILPLFIYIPEETLKLNFNIWCVALLMHCLFVFLIDSYIIFFANMPVLEKLGLFCQRCAGIAVGVTYSNYQLTDNGVTNPNPIFNKTRDYLGLPRAVDHDQIKQYKMMKKFFPNIPETEYTYKTPGVENSNTMSTLNVIKIARENEDFLRDNCTADELRTFTLNIPRRTTR
jgi:hypothetical protein